MGAQQFPEWLLFVVGYVIPLGLIFAVARSLGKADFCISALALTQCVGLVMLTTTITKKMAGRPRPCFYAMCGWVSNSTTGGACTAPQKMQWEARQSFPSGHSSFAMGGMAFLAMYLLEKCDQLERPPRFLTALQLQGAQLCALLPYAVAIWVAISRTTDYWHNYSDILAGSILGFGIAHISFAQRARIRGILEDEMKRDARDTSGAAALPCVQACSAHASRGERCAVRHAFLAGTCWRRRRKRLPFVCFALLPDMLELICLNELEFICFSAHLLE